MTEELAPASPATTDEYWLEEVRKRAIEAGVHYNAIEFTQPEKTARVLKLLAAEYSVRRISKETGMGHAAIQRLKWTHKETLESRRKELARTYGMAAEAVVALAFKKIEMLEDDEDALANTTLKDIALSGAILTDKAMQLSGMATVTIEHRSGPSIEDAQKAIMAARQKVADNLKEGAIDV